jgi:hypothetical protein
MHFDLIDMNNPDAGKTMVCDPTPFDCALPSPSPVTWAGLSP